MKICKDGRIWGQSNREAGDHLGILLKGASVRKGNASEVKQGERNPMWMKRHSLEARKKMSKSTQGANHPNWKGGISSLQAKDRRGIEFRLWRDAVFARDNWTCQECGKRGGKLVPHHIKSFAEYPELRFAIDNGKTLCYECHKLTDGYKGKGRNK